jgi:hypothetical protein
MPDRHKVMSSASATQEEAVRALYRINRMLVEEGKHWYGVERSKTADSISRCEVALPTAVDLVQAGDSTAFYKWWQTPDSLTESRLMSCFHFHANQSRADVDDKKKRAKELWDTVIKYILPLSQE